MLGGLFALFGNRTRVREGKCMFVQGATGDLPPVGVGQDRSLNGGHMWLMTPIGDVDLSPNLTDAHDGWRPMRPVGVVGNDWPVASPHNVVVCTDSATYANLIAAASHGVEHDCAIYFLAVEAPLSFAELADPFRWLSSPRSQWLSGRFSPLIYLKLILHLADVLKGGSRPLATLSASRRWKIVDRRDDGEAGTALAHVATLYGAPKTQ